MKKSVLTAALTAAMVISSAFAVQAFAGAETEPVNLIAGSSAIEFRTLEDFSKKAETYAYYPDGAGINGTGCYSMTEKGKTMAILTDGSIDFGGYNTIASAPKTMAWAYVDLGQFYELTRIDVGYVGGFAYEFNIIQVSSSADFSNDVTTVWANTQNGNTPLYDANNKLVYDGTHIVDSSTVPVSANGQYIYANGTLQQYKVKNVKARYVRLTNKNVDMVTDANTHFTEIAVYGTKVEMPKDVANAQYGTTPKPVASKKSGTLSGTSEVILSCEDENAKIYYTLDGSIPTTSSTLYTQPLKASTYKLRAIAVGEDGSISEIAEYDYSVNYVKKQNNFYWKSLDFTKDLKGYLYTAFLGGENNRGVFDFEGDYAQFSTCVTDNSISLYGNSTYTGTLGWLVFDLGEVKKINRIDFGGIGAYAPEQNVIQVSDTADFSANVTTVFANSTNGNTPLKDENGKVIYSGENVNLGGKIVSVNGQYVYMNNELQIVKFDEIEARYVRLTNKYDSAANPGAADNTVYSEVKIIYANEYQSENYAESIYYNKKEISVNKGTDPDLSSFDKTVYVKRGDEYLPVAVKEWKCENFNKDVSGVYEYVCVLENVDGLKMPYPIKAVNKVIVKGENSISWDTTPADFNYGETVNFTATAVSGDVTLTYMEGDVVLNAMPTEVGNYKVIATSAATETYDLVSISAEFSILKIDNTIVITGETKVYNGEANVFTATANGANVNIAYFAKGSTVALTSAPTHVGEYTVKVTSESTKNYNETVATKDFAITRGQNVVTWSVEPSDKVYDKTALVAEAAATEGNAVITYFVKDSTTALTEAPKNAGEYTVKVTVADSDDMIGATIEKNVVISKADVKVTGTIYKGAALYTSSSMPSNNEFNYDASVDGTFAITSTTLKEGVNELAWTFTPSDAVNYNVATGTVDVNVNKLVALGIEIKSAPDKVTYYQGDKLDLSGMKVVVKYNDGSEKTIENYTVDKQSLVAADTEVTVTYEGMSAKFTVSVTIEGSGCKTSMGGISVLCILAFAAVLAICGKKRVQA